MGHKPTLFTEEERFTAAGRLLLLQKNSYARGDIYLHNPRVSDLNYPVLFSSLVSLSDIVISCMHKSF